MPGQAVGIDHDDFYSENSQSDVDLGNVDLQEPYEITNGNQRYISFEKKLYDQIPL